MTFGPRKVQARHLKAVRLRRRADRLATKIVLEVTNIVQNDGTIDAFDANTAATTVREMIIKFFNSGRRDGLR